MSFNFFESSGIFAADMQPGVFPEYIILFLRRTLGDVSARIIEFADEIDKLIDFEWILSDWSILLVGNSLGMRFVVGEIKFEEEWMRLIWKCGVDIYVRDSYDIQLIDHLFVNNYGVDPHNNSAEYYKGASGSLIMSEENEKRARDEFVYACMLIGAHPDFEGIMPTVFAKEIGAKTGPRPTLHYNKSRIELIWRNVTMMGNTSFLLEISTPGCSIILIEVDSSHVGFYDDYKIVVNPDEDDSFKKATERILRDTISRENSVVIPAEIAADIINDIKVVISLWQASVKIVSLRS